MLFFPHVLVTSRLADISRRTARLHTEGVPTGRRLLRQAFLGLAVATAIGVGTAGMVCAQTAADMNGRLDTLFGGHASYQMFFETLKKAVGTDDRAAVASMVDYPFRTRIHGKSVTIKDAKQFQAQYDDVITAKVKAAVARQTYPALFANAEGVSIGDGALWFSGIGNNDTVRIIAVNN